MEAEGGEAGHPVNMPKALAFYLPQFHPIPENDEWWGTGFTEWTNVMRARPLFPGHYQPHVPGELGYYDLRVPEVRAAQAELARAHGIAGFVYYHYWFDGRRLLERPFNEVLASGQPDFPFALCWANEEWTRNWDAQTGRVLVPQHYSDDDDRAHIRWLLDAFADNRYIKIDGRPLMLVYRADQLPDPQRTTDIWRTEAQRHGFPDLYLCWVESRSRPAGGPQKFGMDATVGFMPRRRDEVYLPAPGARGQHLVDYLESARSEMERMWTPWKRFPSVMVQWDNTPRRPYGATIFSDAFPHLYEYWLRFSAAAVANVRPEENYLFIVAWNEWAEGNHLEPDERYGRAFLEATRDVLLQPDPPTLNQFKAEHEAAEERRAIDLGFDYAYPYLPDSALANVAGLVTKLVQGGDDTVVDLGAGTAVIARPLQDAGLSYHGVEVHPTAVRMMHDAGLHATECDLTDEERLANVLDGLEPVGAFMLLDVIEHLVDPQRLLSALSAWSLKHGEPPLVVSVPNASHFDMGLRLLCGRWTPTETGLLDSTHLRFFTQTTLERLLGRCGWAPIDRDDFAAVRTDQYDPELNDELPAELTAALRMLADAYNPNAAVKQFVWALTPVPVGDPPETFLRAVAPPTSAEGDETGSRSEAAGGRAQPVRDYLDSIGLLAIERHRQTEPLERRAQGRRVPIFARSTELPRWKRAALGVVYWTPGLRQLFNHFYPRPG